MKTRALSTVAAKSSYELNKMLKLHKLNMARM